MCDTAVFVTGLPPDASKDEVVELFARCGVIMDDELHNGPCVFLQRTDAESTCSALVMYLRKESVVLAVDLLDGARLRPGTAELDVQPATPQQCTVFQGILDGGEPDAKRGSAAWKASIQRMERRLEWEARDETRGPINDSTDVYTDCQVSLPRAARSGRVVVLRNMLSVDEEAVLSAFVSRHTDSDGMHERARAILKEVEEDVAGEATDRLELAIPPDIRVYTDGCSFVVAARFADRHDADAAIALMHGRAYDGRRVSAAIYDGSFALRNPVRLGHGTESDDERIARFGNAIDDCI